MTNKSISVSPNSPWTLLILATSILLHLMVSWELAVIRPAWCDEIFTHYHVTGETWQTFWEKTAAGLNRMPPLYFAFCKLLFSSSENPIFLCRILSALFMATSTLVLYQLLRFDLSSVWAASLTMATTSASDFFLEYSYEARPYAAAFLSTVVLLWAIRKYETMGYNKKRTLVLGTFCFLLPALHYTYALTAVALGSGHILITNKDNRMRLLLTYGLVGAFFTATHLPMLVEQSGFGNILMIIAYPTLSVGKGFLEKLFDPKVCLLLLGLLSLGFSILRKRETLYKPIISEDIPDRFTVMVVIGLTIVPLLGFMLARSMDNFWFLPRYYLPSLMLPCFLAYPAIRHLSSHTGKGPLPTIVVLLGVTFTLQTHRKEHEYLFTHAQDYHHSLFPDPSLDDRAVPILTDDLVLYFNYLYRGTTDLVYVARGTELANRLRSFVPAAITLAESAPIPYDQFIYLETIGNRPPLSLDNYKGKPLTHIKTDPVHRAMKYIRSK